MPDERQNPGNVFPTQNRCEHCGAAFTTGALLEDHLASEHDPGASAQERDAARERQNERKP